ncbi:MAG: hypothetical protein ACRCT7_16440 [Shewanella sp.]|nr:hypothetical protein [Shewanella sp. SNU WT4]
MINFLKDNWGILTFISLFILGILGGIYWVEASLAGQEQVIQ